MDKKRKWKTTYWGQTSWGPIEIEAANDEKALARAIARGDMYALVKRKTILVAEIKLPNIYRSN